MNPRKAVLAAILTLSVAATSNAAPTLYEAAAAAGARIDRWPMPPRQFQEFRSSWLTDVGLGVVGSAGDIITTHMIMSRGGVELNPLQRGGDGKRIAFRVAVLGLQTWGSYEMRKARHDRRAEVMRWTLLAVRTGLVLHNMRQLQRH